MTRRHIRITVVLASVALFTSSSWRVDAVTRLASADGQYWDIQDTSPWGQDSGGIATGGRAYPFNGFGYLKLQVRDAAGRLLLRTLYLTGFGLSHDGAERFDSITPVVHGDVAIARAIFAPRDEDYLRYFDSYTNVADEERTIEVAWGGAAGAYEEGGLVAVAATSSGDRRIDPADTYVTVMQNAHGVADPERGPSGHGPSAHVLGARAGVFAAIGDMYADPFTDPWPGYDPAHIGYVFKFAIRPDETVALVTFVVKGLSELYDSRLEGAVRVRDGAPILPAGVPSAAATRIPAAGSEIARVTAIARRLVAQPDFRGLTAEQRAQIRNWPAPSDSRPTPVTVVEQSVEQLKEAMTRGTTTSEDIVRAYLLRIARYDRRGPTFRSLLALNPKAIAEARALDAERAAGRVRGPFHGIPVAFKDNIDVVGIATTGGSRALLDHLPRLDSRVAGAMRAGGAVMLGKTNLDEFPFGDFGISTVGGTVGNAYDPTLSTAGSSGGSAVAVAASLVTLAFGTDTCNSLSNPAAFASLATIRTTRGLTSRAGVMPLNPFNDAVGPMAKSVRDVALAVDVVAGSDPEDPVTADARRHITGSLADRLDANALAGARIGMLRQRFVGVTGEREIAALMDVVGRELRAAGATVLDVPIDDIDARYRLGRGTEPGALKAGWNAYLARGARPGERVLTIEDLLASEKLVPRSASRFRAALAPTPTGAELTEAVARFYAAREEFRDLFVRLLDTHRLDALLYPANLARPHTHEGGLERFGGEPSTCIESAGTGLPQVTVAAGFIQGRYPVGVSLLGRAWTDGRLLALAYSYEQATRHRRPPPAIK